MAGDQEKSEEATPERRRKAREDGQFPRGKDAGNTVASVAVLLMLGTVGDDITGELQSFSTLCFSEPFQLVLDDPTALAGHIGKTIAVLVLPLAAAAALGAAALGVAEAGYHPLLQLAAPKWERLDPLPRLRQMFAPHEAALNVGIQLLRVAAVGAVAYACVSSAFDRLMRLGRVDIQAGAMALLDSVLLLALWSSLALGLLALVDYFKSRHQHEQSIRMSQQEVKDELKQQQGDPRVKQRQRAKAREMVRRGLLQAVQQSDFVIANPTHISVALRYRVSEGAPIVTAKGYDEVALYMRKLAKEHDVPVIENKPLARALAKRVRAGHPVPVELYAAVAEVLAFVYRLKSKTIQSLSESTPPR